MNEDASSLRGRCDSCGKVLRVPQAGKTYRCKACGGSVVAEQEEPAIEDAPEDEARHEPGPVTRVKRTPDRRHVGSPRPIAGRGFTVLALLGLAAVVDAVAVYSGFAQRSLILRARDGVEISTSEADANDLFYGGVGLVQVGLFWITAVCWLVWIHRASSNQRPLGAKHVSYSPGWAVGGWFVPFLNLWRPYQVTAELWRHSAVAALSSAGAERPRAPRPALVATWWAAWIFGNVLASAAGRAGRRADEVQELLDMTDFMLASDAFSIVSVALAFFVVFRITAWQRAAGA